MAFFWIGKTCKKKKRRLTTRNQTSTDFFFYALDCNIYARNCCLEGKNVNRQMSKRKKNARKCLFHLNIKCWSQIEQTEKQIVFTMLMCVCKLARLWEAIAFFFLFRNPIERISVAILSRNFWLVSTKFEIFNKFFFLFRVILCVTSHRAESERSLTFALEKRHTP